MAKERKEEKIEVEILSRTEVTTFPKLRQPLVQYVITYAAAGLPPATIWIPKAEWSKEEEAKRIREDIEKRLKVKPEIIKV